MNYGISQIKTNSTKMEKMKLKKLLKNIANCTTKGSLEIVITGVSANSKTISPGNLFIAKKGQTYDGTKYVSEAIERGCQVILTDLYNPSLKHVTQILHPNPAEIEAYVAAEFYKNPSDELLAVGITGTNGKTTTSLIIKYLLDNFYGLTGLIGSIEYHIGSQLLQATRTTPDVTTNQRLLREMLNHDCQAVVMEVTSHALMQGRVDQIDYDVAVFTQLTADHLDYHGTMQAYCEAKNRLFLHLNNKKSKKARAKWAVVNQDCEWTPKILQHCSAKVLTYGINNSADLKATNIRLNDQETIADFTYLQETVTCSWPLIGRFNIYNCLAAVGVLLTQGFSLQDIAQKLSNLPSTKGRLQQVDNALNLKIYVDFAHTEDALKNVLKTLTEVKKGKLITVFGCGGDRDKSKRPKMAKVCEEYSDYSIVTSDNPRSENPEIICREMMDGFSNNNNFMIELDRYEAIRLAIQQASSNDLILIAGKGHETHQIFAHHTIEFDDCQVATEICVEIAQAKGKLCGV